MISFNTPPQKERIRPVKDLAESVRRGLLHSQKVAFQKASAERRKTGIARARKYGTTSRADFEREKALQGKRFDLLEYRVKESRKLAAFVLDELIIGPTIKATLKKMLDHDSNLYYAHLMFANKEFIPKEEIVDLLKTGIAEINLLPKSTLKEYPIILENKGRILQIVDLIESEAKGDVTVPASAIDLLKYVNNQLVKQLLGKEYEYYLLLNHLATEPARI